jgi:DNA-binding response OmpR family regulator
VNAKKRVMIIDDDKEFLEEIAHTLNTGGYRTITVSESVDALAEAVMAKPDIIFLDLKMSKKSGFSVANELMENANTKNIPVIAITGIFAQDEISLLSKICNIKEYLTKPINPLDIISRIESICKP